MNVSQQPFMHAYYASPEYRRMRLWFRPLRLVYWLTYSAWQRFRFQWLFVLGCVVFDIASRIGDDAMAAWRRAGWEEMKRGRM